MLLICTCDVAIFLVTLRECFHIFPYSLVIRIFSDHNNQFAIFVRDQCNSLFEEGVLPQSYGVFSGVSSWNTGG